jgi:hypothetical protein
MIGEDLVRRAVMLGRSKNVREKISRTSNADRTEMHRRRIRWAGIQKETELFGRLIKERG